MSPFADAASDLTIDAEWDSMCDDPIHQGDEELFSSSSIKEVCTVLKEWTSDGEDDDDNDNDCIIGRGNRHDKNSPATTATTTDDNNNNDDDDDMMMMDDIMKVDEQIGSNFLSDDLFGHCPSPVTPQEELYGSCDYYYYSNSNSSCSSQDKMGSSAMLMTPPLSPEYPTRVTLPPITAATPGSSSSDCNTEEYRQAFFNLMESMKKSQETRVSLTMKSSKATDAYERRKSVRDVLSSIEQSRCQIEQCFGSHLASTSSPLLLSSSSSSFSSSSKDVLDAIMTEQ